MSLFLDFLSSKRNQLIIESTDSAVVNHFNNTENNTQFIINQFEEMRGYLEPVFKDRNDLSVLDIGANIGLFSLWISDSCNQIVAVEPNYETFDVLTRLTASVSNITNFNVALSDHDGMVTFFQNENSTTNSLLNRGGKSIEVPCLSLTSLIQESGMNNIDLVKVDIEGSEMLAFDTARILAVKDIVNTFYFEVHQTDIQLRPWPGNLVQNRDFIASQFIDAGYNVLLLNHDKIFTWRKE